MAPADDSPTSDLPRSTTAVQKRSEQLKRWLDSETNKENSNPKDVKKVKVAFQDDCIFLAACAAGDKEEVVRLLSRGSDINTSNIDGLTALHQACIDDHIEMVGFLIDHGADIDRGDNEGWTPLHATASCGYLNIAKLLIERGARIDIVNNDGELPIDIADSEEMESLLQAEVFRRGINLDSARSQEEQVMLNDIKQWYSSVLVEEPVHPKTGATPLHVAAAKGYHDVLRMLIELGVDLNPRDTDGWTPIHASAHWGHREGCQLLVQYGCEVDVKTNLGQSVMDLCEPEMTGFLDDLIKRQAMLVRDNAANMEKRVSRIQLRNRSAFHPKEPTLFPGDLKTGAAAVPKVADSPWRNMNSSASSEPSTQRTLLQKLASNSHLSSPVPESKINPLTADQSREQPVVIKPISFLPPSSIEKPAEPPKAQPVSPRVEKPISFLPPNEFKPISFLKSQDTPVNTNPFPVTSKSSVGQTTEPIKMEPAQPKPSFAGISFLRPTEELKADPKPELSPVSTPKTLQSPVQKLQFESAVSRAVNKPSATDLQSIEYIDTSSTSSPVTTPSFESSKAPSVNDRTAKSTGDSFSFDAASKKLEPPPPSPQVETSTTATVRRSFQPPARDEESEAQRKAHAKRVRESRRSTQGVTADDIRQADAKLKSSTTDNEPKASIAPTLNIPTEAPASREDEKENRNTDQARSGQSYSQPGRWLAPDSNAPAGSNRPLTLPPSSPEAVITLPLRKGKAEEGDGDDQKNTRRRRPKRRSTGVVNYEMEDDEGATSGTDLVPDKDTTHQNGISYLPPTTNGSQSNPIANTSSTDRGAYSSRTKYDSGLERTPSSRTSRASSISSISSSTNDKENDKQNQDEGEKDWKKLYEQEKAENEKLRRKLQETEKDLTDTKADLQKASTAPVKSFSGLSEAEKRERRALERKIAELEEDLKEIEILRADNQRLKEENGALIRVISKLSK